MTEPGRRGAGRTPAGLRVVEALRLYLNESDLYLAAAGRGSELHRTDLAGLGALVANRADPDHPMTPGRLSEALALSPAATTAMLDRLQAHGLVTRDRNPADRRSVVVEATDDADAMLWQMVSPLSARMTALLATRDDDDLAVVAAFVEQAVAETRQARLDLPSSPPR